MKRYLVAEGSAGNHSGMPFDDGTGLAAAQKMADPRLAVRRSIAGLASFTAARRQGGAEG